MKVLRDILRANKNKKIIIMPVGISGSGKTTLYKSIKDEFDIEYISFDSLRINEFLKSGKKVEDKNLLYREAYRYVNEKRIKLLPLAKRQMRESKKNIIYIDNTNLKKKARHKFLCEANSYLKIAVYFKPDLELAIKRQKNKDRDKYVSPKIIQEQLSYMEKPSFDEFDIIISKNPG